MNKNRAFKIAAYAIKELSTPVLNQIGEDIDSRVGNTKEAIEEWSNRLDSDLTNLLINDSEIQTINALKKDVERLLSDINKLKPDRDDAPDNIDQAVTLKRNATILNNTLVELTVQLRKFTKDVNRKYDLVKKELIED